MTVRTGGGVAIIIYYLINIRQALASNPPSSVFVVINDYKKHVQFIF